MNTKKSVKHTASPLPFMGQKRNFAKKFIAELQNFDDDLIFVDLFGGSGVLSHLTKQEKPNSTVIYNDFDNFQLRLNSVERTSKIIDFCRKVLKDYNKGEKVRLCHKQEILEFIKIKQKEWGYIDYITIGSQLLFSGQYFQNFNDFSKATFYTKIRKSPFVVKDYLNDVEIVCKDYRDLFDEYKNKEKVVFIIDPPYFQTQSIGYKNTWNLQQHLDCINVLDSKRFFYFTSSKSGIIEFMEWLDKNDLKTNPFNCCKRLSHRQMVNHENGYEDIMFVKPSNQLK